jgi:hypothetical protein
MSDSPRLSHSVKSKDYASLRTLNDVCEYMVALPAEIAQKPVWRDAAALALDARLWPSRNAMAALTKQIELALSYPALTSDEHSRSTPPLPGS